MPVDLTKVRCGVKAPSPATTNFYSISEFFTSFPENLQTNWAKTVPNWSMLGNDKYGCCTISSIFHFLETVGSYAGYGKGHSGTESECLGNYSDISGFDISIPASDVGCIPSDVFTHWLNSKIRIDGALDAPQAVFKVSNQSITEIVSASAFFGPLIVDAALPEAIEGKTHWTCETSTVLSSEPASFGNHQFLLTGFNGENFQYASWDETITSDIGWWNKYITEVWAVIHPLWLLSNNAIPGFDYNFLISEAKALHLSPA